MNRNFIVSMGIFLSFATGIGIGKYCLVTEDDFLQSAIFKKHIHSLKGLEEEYNAGVAKNNTLYRSLTDYKKRNDAFDKRFNERGKQFKKNSNNSFDKPKSNENQDNL